MTTVPNCPKHGTALRAGKYPGTWFCPRVIGKDDDGQTMFCKERIKDSPGGPADPVAFQKPQQATQNASGGQIGRNVTQEADKAYQDQYHWYAALTFAASIYRGTGKASEALELAAAARALLP